MKFSALWATAILFVAAGCGEKEPTYTATPEQKAAAIENLKNNKTMPDFAAREMQARLSGDTAALEEARADAKRYAEAQRAAAQNSPQPGQPPAGM